MSWFILLGAAVGVRESDHLGFEVGLAMSPPPLRAALIILIGELPRLRMFGHRHAASMAAQLAAGTWSDRMPIIGISRGWDYVPMAAGGGADRPLLRSRSCCSSSPRREGRPRSASAISPPRRRSEPWNSGFSSASSRCFLLIGTPVAFCLGIASLATVAYMGLPPVVVFQQMNSGMNAFAMMAIPFFIYAGDLMIRGGIAERLIQMASSLVGHLRGGLGQVNVVTCTLFGGISGSAVADASAVGGLMIPQMKSSAAMTPTMPSTSRRMRRSSRS
jgi:hypothetical protein